MVGSAITDKADAEKEYEECLLKAQAIVEVLGGSSVNKRASDYAGILTREEGDKFHEYLKKAREERDRDID